MSERLVLANQPIPFVPGLELSRALYDQGVRPILERQYPDLLYGAGRLDSGSEVLGFDTPRSMDHTWGARQTLFLPETVYNPVLADGIRRLLGEALPFEVRGVPTHFHAPEGVDSLVTQTSQRPINHGVSVTTLRSVLHGWLGIDAELARDTPVPRYDGSGASLSVEQWLTIPEQQLRTFTTGAVFRDDTGELARARAMLRWYPQDVWLYLLAAQWGRIAQEEAFMGRTAEVGDELGSRLVAGRMVREVMHLCFLMERQYAPYTKWFGSAFARLACAARLHPCLLGTLTADNVQERERHLSAAYEAVAEQHNALAITPPVEPRVSRYHSRPFQVIHGERFVEALRVAIADERLQRLAAEPHGIIGSTSQWADSTDVLCRRWDAPLRALYRSSLDVPD